MVLILHSCLADMAIISEMLILIVDENGCVCRDLQANNKRKRAASPTQITTVTPIINGANWGGLFGLNEAKRT